LNGLTNVKKLPKKESCSPFIIPAALQQMRTTMVDFSYICKNLSGSQPTKGQESGLPSCTKHQEPGDYCTVDSAEDAQAGKKKCPAADYLKILSFKKKK